MTKSPLFPVFDRLVAQLVDDHLHTVDTPQGVETKLEASLLQQLEDSLVSSFSGGGSGSGTGSPVNLGTLVLMRTIGDDIHSTATQYSPSSLADPLMFSVLNTRSSLRVRVSMLAAGWETPANLPHLVDMFTRWVHDIRLHLNPPKPPLPLRGYTCPACNYSKYTTTIDGETLVNPALTYRYDSNTVGCKACGKCFDVGEFKDLRRR